MNQGPKTKKSMSGHGERGHRAQATVRSRSRQTIDYPMSCGQRALWCFNRLYPDSAAYTVSCAALLREEVDQDTILSAFRALMHRHPILRTTYTTVDGTPIQRVNTNCDVPLHVIDARCWSWEQIESHLERESNRPFDLETGPVFRIQLLARRECDWILHFCAAHIAVDFWSIEVLFHELEQLYSSPTPYIACSATTNRSHGSYPGPSDLAPLQFSYLSFVDWQRRMLETPAARQSWDFWRDQLSGELPTLELPTDRPRQPLQTSSGASHVFQLPIRLAASLLELARREKVTPFVLMLAAFQAFIYRYSGQRDILVGCPTAGRNRKEFEPLVGFFINPVVIRRQLDPESSFRAFMHDVSTAVVEGLAHQDFPFPLLVERLQVPRDPGRSPIFQVAFSWDRPRMDFADGRPSTPETDQLSSNPSTALRRSGENSTALGLRPFSLSQAGAAFDLSLMILHSRDTLTATMQYNSSLFDGDTIRRMAADFESLVRSAVVNPDEKIARLAILGHETQHRLEKWNQTMAPSPGERTVHQLFEAQVCEVPDAIAATHGNRSITYRELNATANQLARDLIARGVGPAHHVGILMEPSLELLQALIAIHKTGAAFVPVAPETPEILVAETLRETEAQVLLGHTSLAGNTPDGVEVVPCNNGNTQLPAWPSILGHEDHDLDRPIGSGQLAYTLFTSGSTGQRKGVQVAHSSVCNLLNAMRRRLGLTRQDRFLAVTTISFDISVLEVFLPLTSGAHVALVDRKVAADGFQLRAELVRSQATIMQATPSTWRMLVDCGWPGDKKLMALSGGEALPRELADRLLERCGSVWNLYGPTETTIWSSAQRVAPGTGPIPIGGPIDNTRFYVVDRHHQLVPIGVPGELLIAGHGLARGYLNDPKLTAEKFIPDPFDNRPGARVFKTGDQVRYRSPGFLEWLGRSDRQIKIRGHRIEPGEIETHLDRHPRVRQSLVVSRNSDCTGNRQQLCAYILTSGEPPTPIELRRFLGETLPPQYLPEIFVQLDRFPLNPAGKIDVAALPPSVAPRPKIGANYAVPKHGREADLAQLWASILGIARVGRHDDFFDLGGNSISCVEMAVKANTQGLELTPAMIFQYRTPARLAEAITAQITRSNA
jgi:amino acid adenylation domain-containing protein